VDAYRFTFNLPCQISIRYSTLTGVWNPVRVIERTACYWNSILAQDKNLGLIMVIFDYKQELNQGISVDTYTDTVFNPDRGLEPCQGY